MSVVSTTVKEPLRRNGVALKVNERVWNAVLGCRLKNDIMVSVRFHGKPFSITVILRIKRFWKHVHTQEATKWKAEMQSALRSRYVSISATVIEHVCPSRDRHLLFSFSLLFSASGSDLLFPNMAAPRPVSKWPSSYSSQVHRQPCSWILSQITNSIWKGWMTTTFSINCAMEAGSMLFMQKVMDGCGQKYTLSFA